jgi:polynucleotide kinase-phosphatase
MRKANTTVTVPELSLIVLIGVSSSGKSTFARRHFKPSEIISSDQCRLMVSDDENSLAASADAFELARFITAKRLKGGLLTVIDATNVQEDARKDWISIARAYHALPVAIVINTPEKVCQERSEIRPDRQFGKHVIPQQISQLRRSIRKLKWEGFRHIYEMRGPEEVDAVESIVREPLYNNKKSESGPFDIIGDIHGCYDELVTLLRELGYQEGNGWRHPEGRKPVFVGDLVDRGPKTPQVLRLVMELVNNNLAWAVPGNHDVKLLKWLNGKNVQLNHGLQQTVEQLLSEPEEFRQAVKSFIDGLISHYVFDKGHLVVAHAGLREDMQGRGSGAVREFCLYGETTGETDEFGLPVRYNWAAEYKGNAMVVYGHTPVPEAQWLNRTIDIDTGCVFGGKLTAMRYPERELVSVPALKVYCEPVRPLDHKAGQPDEPMSLQQQHDDLLDISDVTGKHIVETRHGHNITIQANRAIVALEVMSRFAINPKWLMYLPPTMSPAETSLLGGFLEHPKEALDYYRGVGMSKVICEEKHMGSRAVVIVCKDEGVVRRVFGIGKEGIGVVYTRTGRAFFGDEEVEQAFLQRLNKALAGSGFYEQFETEWVCLDAELMPWSAKAQSLLQGQYGAVGAAGSHALKAAVEVLKRGDFGSLRGKYSQRQDQVERFIAAYHQYCWLVKSLDDYKLAPFHILATEGKTWFEEGHEWHMKQIAEICMADTGMLLATPFREVDLQDEESEKEVTEWWLKLTAAGGEGMVVKPADFVASNKRGLVQPAIKIRGREYLRIIYGPEYTSPENMERLKKRGLSGKRSLALREFALGLEGLARWVAGEPLRRVHECVFGVLALESEPLDPRL